MLWIVPKIFPGWRTFCTNVPPSHPPNGSCGLKTVWAADTGNPLIILAAIRHPSGTRQAFNRIPWIHHREGFSFLAGTVGGNEHAVPAR